MRKVTLIFFSLYTICSFAQRGKNGNLTVNNPNTIVNSYTHLTQNINAGSQTINAGSNAGITPGDLLLVIQMQGATLRGTVDNNTWGEILNYNNAGRYEFHQVNSVSGSGQIILDCELKYSYSAAGRTQIIKVPRYNNLTINNGASITAPTWNGQTGGVVVVETLNNTVINGSVNVNGKGFRGGLKDNNTIPAGSQFMGYRHTDNAYGGEKGEGIGGFGPEYDALGGRICRAAPGNGGGGGNGHNSGGGGGANAGIGTWNGLGNPNPGPNNAYVTAWNLEGGNFANNTSSGGGRGGYSFSMSDQNAMVVAPGNPVWAGDHRENNGGNGGRPLDYGNNTERIFMGGGGGAGDGNNFAATDGASAGGIVFLVSYAQISGNGQIYANGNDGFLTPPNGNDAPGGGGGGGTIVLSAVGQISGISTYANGGVGGSQHIVTIEAEGPGGGGGGGYIAKSNGNIFQQANGAPGGLTDSPSLTEFPPNGATGGANGLTNQIITNFWHAATDTSVCAGETAILNSSLSGSVPTGTVVLWYAVPLGGNPLHTGSSFTTPPLLTTTTYYVATCPGTYRIPVTVTVNSAQANAGNNQMLCVGQSVNFTATGGGTYLWNTGATTQSINVNPQTTITYTVTVTATNGCTDSDAVVATVNMLPNVVAGANQSICTGNTAQISASGGVYYTWSPTATLSNPNIYNPVANPTNTTTYTVTATDANGCSNTDNVIVEVYNLPIVNAGLPQSVCLGDTAVFTASGGTSYLWSSGQNTQSITVSPSNTTTYIVTVSDNNGCSASDETVLTIMPLPNVNAENDTTICLNTPVQLNGSGGIVYVWTPATYLSNDSIANPIATPSTTTTYTLTVYDHNSCSASDAIVLGVFPLPQANAGLPQSHCLHDSVTLQASGASVFQWNTGQTSAAIIVSPVISTTYTVTVTDNNGCTDSDGVIVTVFPLPVANAGHDTLICDGDQIQMQGYGGANYVWSPNQYLSSTSIANPIATPQTDITYTLMVTDINGCTATDEIYIGLLPLPVISFQPVSFHGCQPLTVNFTDYSQGDISSWLWNFGDLTSAGNSSTQQHPSYTYSNPGTYSVSLTVSSTAGCQNSGSANSAITVYQNPVADFYATPVTTDIYSPLVSFFDQSIDAVSWYWDFGDAVSNSNYSSQQNPEHTYHQEGTYKITLIVVSNEGCIDSTFNYITVEPRFTFFIPNAFTPNGDGVNDYFAGIGAHFTDYQLYVFNRWGEIIYETHDYSKPWNGKYRNIKDIDIQDVYVYKIIVKDLYGKRHVYIGHVTLLK